MIKRNLEFQKHPDQDLINREIESLFFTVKSRIFRHRFSSPFLQTHTVDTEVFSERFFLDSNEIFVAFPNGKDLDIYLSKNQNDLRSYLLRNDTVDYETDIYLFSTDLSWCIRYIDEFYDDNSRMTFLHSNERLI